MKGAANRCIYSSKAYLNQHPPCPVHLFSSHRLNNRKPKIRNMKDFLDEVRHDISLAKAEKRHLQHSIQLLSLQVDTIMDEIDSNERELTCIINLFAQRRNKSEQKIQYCRL
jgi:hypothetical protein